MGRENPARVPREEAEMIFDQYGLRKYLTADERQRFIEYARSQHSPKNEFCLALALTGCRLSEALELTSGRVDVSQKWLVIRCLKKRNNAVYRYVPIPDWYALQLRDAIACRSKNDEDRLWPWSRTTGWIVVKETMAAVGIAGLHASPKGLRHSFGVTSVTRGVPINVVQRWLGHSRSETTAIYVDVVGAEERALAGRLW